jgi:GNAT superfamily N-acetyltransferase
MVISEVNHPQEVREFLQLPVRLYKDAPHWIRPLDKDIEAVFDPEKNKSFRDGECTRWILRDETGVTVGRVAAFILKKTANRGNDQPTGGMGFFECINDRKAAFLLFDQCKSWLHERGMEAMDGPINFGSREKWWGLLAEGFDQDPNYQCNYNFPYYVELFETYGFKLYFNQLTFTRKVMEPLSDRLNYKAELVGKDPDYAFRCLSRKEIGKLPDLILRVYNRAWTNRAETPELNQAQARILVNQMKPILDPGLLWFGFYKEDPVAFFLSLPEINQWFRHVNGKLNWLGLLKLGWFKLMVPNRKAFGILFGVVPEHQGKGVDGALIVAARQLYQSGKLPYTEYEMNWIGDFNPKMIQVVEQVGARVNKRHITYRKLFDESKPFKRHPILA